MSEHVDFVGPITRNNLNSTRLYVTLTLSLLRKRLGSLAVLQSLIKKCTLASQKM